jgi:general secretion pathway protein D
MFKNKTNQIGKTELIIIITPHVIFNSKDARRIMEEFRREMRTYAPRRLRQHRSLENTARRIFE